MQYFDIILLPLNWYYDDEILAALDDQYSNISAQLIGCAVQLYEQEQQ
jgi:hypothetical protein